jgi:hypothetical protein
MRAPPLLTRPGATARAGLATGLALLALATHGAVVEEIVSLKGAGAAVLPYLLSTDEEHPATAVAVLFTGGAGRLGLLDKGIPQPGANFLVRSRRLFVTQGVATAVVDSPSDLRGMNDRRRMGQAVDGVVLTSSVFNSGPGGPGLSGFDYAALQGPLLVHHADDGCPVTPHHEAARLARRYPLITVHGGLP